MTTTKTESKKVENIEPVWIPLFFVVVVVAVDVVVSASTAPAVAVVALSQSHTK